MAAGRFTELRDLFREAGDVIREGKLDRLILSHESGEMAVAFVGHFSAGKSTIINCLLGGEWLPGHPQPTSANVVRISFGEPGAAAVLTDASVRRAPVADEAALRAALDVWCRDGDAVREIELTVPAPILAEGLCFLDTPGADSTDERHAAGMRDMLFLADLTVFVTDYNHVESTFNFSFIERLQQGGKPYVVIVNQIDKHSEWELPFVDFANGVRAAFAKRSLTPLSLYFLSALEPDWPGSEWPRLTGELPQYARRAAQTVEPSLHMLAQEHERWCDERTSADETGGAWMDAGEASAWQEAHDRTMQALQAIETTRAGRAMSFRAELLDPIRSAILAPYETTERAVAYILALRPDFRVGLIGTRAKTDAERRARLESLTADLARRAAVYVEAYLVRAAQKVARGHGVLAGQAAQDFASLCGLVDEALVRATVARGAQLDRDYGYRYAKDLERAIRERYAQAAEAIVGVFERDLLDQDAGEWGRLCSRLKELEALRPAVEAALVRAEKRAVHSARVEAAVCAGARGEAQHV